MFLSYDDLVHTSSKVGNKRTLSFNPLVQFADINCFSHKYYYFYCLNSIDFSSMLLVIIFFAPKSTGIN